MILFLWLIICIHFFSFHYPGTEVNEIITYSITLSLIMCRGLIFTGVLTKIWGKWYTWFSQWHYLL